MSYVRLWFTNHTPLKLPLEFDGVTDVISVTADRTLKIKNIHEGKEYISLFPLENIFRVEYRDE